MEEIETCFCLLFFCSQVAPSSRYQGCSKAPLSFSSKLQAADSLGKQLCFVSLPPVNTVTHETGR